MSLEKKKKFKKNQSQKPGILSKIKGEWLQKRPVLFFVLGFAILEVLFYILWLSDFFEHSVTPRINGVNAKLASVVLNILGQGTHADGFSIMSNRFSISIAMGCDAVEAMALFVIAVITFPGKIRQKLVGVVSGVVILFILNQVRIISLFLVGIYYPKAFEMMHVEVWQFLFIIFAVGLWVLWIKWSRTLKPNVA